MYMYMYNIMLYHLSVTMQAHSHWYEQTPSVAEDQQGKGDSCECSYACTILTSIINLPSACIII